jgi:hypothetical protein
LTLEFELDRDALGGDRQDVALDDLAVPRVVAIGDEAGLVVEVADTPLGDRRVALRRS